MADPTGYDPKPDTTPGRNEVGYWLRQIHAAEKRETKYRQRADRALKVYEANEDAEVTQFNVLYSNTETLQPALYNEVPRPVVKRRWKEENPAAKWGAEAISRGLTFTLDNPTVGHESLHTIMDDVVLSALVPGRGAARFYYEADIEGYDTVKVSEKETQAADDQELGDVDGEQAEITEPKDEGKEKELIEQQKQQAEPMVHGEYVCAKVQKWNQFYFGFAKRWDSVPWIAYWSDMTKKDVEKSFGKAWAKKLTYSSKEDETREGVEDRKEDKKRAELTTRVWEIWIKSRKEILFVAECYLDGPIKRDKDPLGLTGFYNMPEPLHFGRKISTLIPTPIYEYYRKQAEELNHLTERIDHITEAIKVRGFYDGSLQKLSALMEQPDNTLMPAEGVQQLKDGAKLQDLIWLMPLNELVVVLQTLTQEREGVKRVIYEITGIADILRGSSVASETATAQNIKDKWGSLRLKKMQKRVQRYVRECFRIISEIMSEHFSEETFAQMTQLPLMTTKQKEQLTQEFQGLQAQLQQQQAMQAQSAQAPQGVLGGMQSAGAQQSPGPGGAPDPSLSGQQAGPPEPQAPDPLEQKVQEMQAQLSQPSWGEVIELLKKDLLRGYLIDVETNSTIDPEAVEDRQAFSEMMNGMGQAMQQFIPAVQQGIMSMPLLKGMLKGISRRYNIGTEFEESIDQLANELPPPPPDPAMEVKKIEAEGKKLDVQARQQEMQQKQQLSAVETRNKIKLMEAELRVQEAELRIKEKELQLKEQELAMKERELNVKREDTAVQVDRQRQLAQVKHDGMMAAAQAKTMLAQQGGQQGAALPVQM